MWTVSMLCKFKAKYLCTVERNGRCIDMEASERRSTRSVAVTQRQLSTSVVLVIFQELCITE